MAVIVSRKQNSKGATYSIQREGENFGVWKLCENYCRHSADGIRRTWRYVERGMTLEAAQKLFDRRTK
ncbi:hypothetical protein ACFZOW_17140 [Pseudomonas aeruginosa]|uniref:hypothetical protein n=1 Tax=Pseudomonas aeruginosa TaxID=287 RepID=UPI001432E3A4|nr:hypothetical protein [Pseudomonas aeruginosa]NKC37452.1 hypothetical protein [Pseudomonas aeruginosa]NKC55513.1 hypothetical protein [Pseudomonas aeruginosa]